MPPIPPMPTVTDTGLTFALEKEKLDVCNGILKVLQETLRQFEKVLEPSGGSVGHTAAAVAPEGGTASSSRSVQRQRPQPPRPYPQDDTRRERRQRSVPHLYGFEW